MKSILAVLAATAMMATSVKGHGFMVKPKARNVISRENQQQWCPHCFNAGGTGNVIANTVGDGSWPYPETSASTVRAGLCGDAPSDDFHLQGGKFYNGGEIQATYTPGGVIDIELGITAHHNGFFEFFLCDKSDLADPDGPITQECLNKHKLVRADEGPSATGSPFDENYPGRYFLEPKCSLPTNNFGFIQAYQTKFQYRLPEGLTCDHCVLQWYWVTANTCLAPGMRDVNWPTTHSECIGDGGAVGWVGTHLSDCGEANTYPEEFWNCADIKIVGEGSTRSPTEQSPTSSPTEAAKTSSPTEAVTTSSPTEAVTTSSPTEGDSGTCSSVWKQCGGVNWDGPTCCESGLVCNYQNKWYSQCIPSSEPTRQPTDPTTSSPTQGSTASPTRSPTDEITTSKPTASPDTSCASLWDQCGGENHNGPTCCEGTAVCNYQNQWYSQCVPSDDENINPTSSPTAPTTPTAFPTFLPSGESVDSTGFATAHGKLSLDGVHLVDEKGERVQLMGMSSHGLHWFGECATKESISFLVKNWGINLFRAAMYIGENGFASQPSLADKVDEIVDICEDLGVYVMIDWHVLTPGDPNAYLDSEGASSGLAIDYWKSVAEKYKNKKHVLYETANEPNGVSWETVKKYHDAVIPAIRAIDPETIIIAGTPTWSQDIHLAAANPVADPYNVMYAFHFYAGTHDFLLSRVEQYASEIPIFATEWGTSEASGNNGPFLDVAQRFLDLFSGDTTGVKISWAQWSYADKAETSAALQPGACGSNNWDDVSESGAFLRDYIKANVKTANGEARRALSSGRRLRGRN